MISMSALSATTKESMIVAKKSLINEWVGCWVRAALRYLLCDEFSQSLRLFCLCFFQEKNGFVENLK